MANVAKERDAIKENALKAYSFATHKAERGVLSANPVRLSLALNFSLFTCYCMGELEQAAKMSQRAIVVAKKKIDQVNDPEQKIDADAILKLLEENVKGWKLELFGPDGKGDPADVKKKAEEKK